MLQVVYTNQEFKNTVITLIKKKYLDTKIQDVNFVKFTNRFEKISEIIDDATGLILEFNPAQIRKTIMIFSSARFIGIPTIIGTTQLPKNKTASLILRNLRTVTIFKTKPSKQELQTLEKFVKKTRQFEKPAKQLDATNNYINIHKQVKSKLYQTKIYYLKTRNDKTPPLIFLHGITARSAAYLTTLKTLKKYFQIIAIDLPYHGRSDIITPNPPDFETFSEIISETIWQIYKKENLSQRNAFYIMGHSLGGALTFYAAQQLTQKYKIPITRIFLLNPAGGEIKGSQAKLFYTTVVKKLLNIEKYYVLRNNFKRILIEILINYIRAFEKRTTKQNFFQLMKQIPQGYQNFDNMHYSGPTTLIFSDQDNYFDAEYILNYCQHFDNLHFRFSHGMHDWVIIEPNQLEDIIKPIILNPQKPPRKAHTLIKRIFKLFNPLAN